MKLDRLKKLYDLINEKNGENIVIFDVSEMSNFTNYFIITTALSRAHLKQLMEDVPYNFKKETEEIPYLVEGTPDSGWIILDYSDIIVHIFSKEKREYYNLEKIWGACKRINFED